MVRNTIIIIVIIILSFAVTALANDGGAMLDDDECVEFDYAVKSDEIAIGETMVFELTLTNKTDVKISYFELDRFFVDSYVDDTRSYTATIELEPYETKTFEIKYQVPKSIKWYKDGENFYADFAPALIYYSNEESDYIQLSWSAYNENDKIIPLKIINIEDGSEYLEITTLDDRKRLIYSETQYGVSHMYWEYYDAMAVSYFNIKSISDEDIDLLYFRGIADCDGSGGFYPLESTSNINTMSSLYFSALPEKVQKTQIVGYNVLFETDNGGYKGIYFEREFTTDIYLKPDVNVRFAKNSDGTMECEIWNNSDETIDDLFAVYSESYYRDMTQMDKDMVKGSLGPDDIWQIPIVEEETNDNYTKVMVGYILDGCLHYWTNYFELEKGKDEIVNMKDEWYEYGTIEDLYYYYYDIEYTPLRILDEYDHNEQTPQVTASPTASPAKEIKTSATPEIVTSDISVSQTDARYIPRWVWILLCIVLAVTVFVVVNLRESKIND